MIGRNATVVDDWSELRKGSPAIGDPSEETTARLYRVQKGDDLCSIARSVYGLADFWIFIYGANQAEISRREGVVPGQILLIPDF